MITFAYDENAGSADKILRLSCDVPCLSWTIWGEPSTFARIADFLRTGGDHLRAGESGGGKIYWSMSDGELWILLADLESWDIGLHLREEERLALIATIASGPQA